MGQGPTRLPLPGRTVLTALIAAATAVAIVVGLTDGVQTATPTHTYAIVGGGLLLALTATRGRAAVPWTWLAFGAGALLTQIVTSGAHYESALSTEPAISGVGYFISWVGVWMLREQRVQGGQIAFFLDALGSLVAVATLACLVSLAGRGPFHDGSEMMYTLGLATSIMLATVVPIFPSVSRTPFCARDRWLTAAFASALAGTVLLTLALRRDLPLTAPGLALIELELPLMAIAATRRPGVAAAFPLGTWWEWVPPACWAIVGASTLVVALNTHLPTALVGAGVVGLAFATARFAHTVREVGSAVVERHTSLTDDLTGLPNRHALFDELSLLTLSRGASGERATLVVIGIDRFRSLNDTLGHASADALLVAVGERLAEVTAGAGTLYRIAGDEFAICVRSEDDVERTSAAMRSAFSRLFEVEGINIALTASVGTAEFPGDAKDAAELARKAEVAMTDAKRRGLGISAYDPEQDWYSVAHLALADELRSALRGDDDSLWVGFQPQLDLRSGRIHGVEALVRWRHPVRGEVSPAEILPIAERSGLMSALTDWVLEQTIATAAKLGGATSVRFAVNVSAATLVDVRLPERIALALEHHRVDPRRLVIEVTEDAVMSDPERCLRVLSGIGALGVEVAIDDFGTGHSTLAQVRSLPAQELKIDRGFVRGMTSDRVDAEIVRLIVTMAREVGMRVVAEGVETDIERQMLTDIGCELVQGYGIARPMPAAELRGFLAAHEGPLQGDRAA